MNIKILFFVLFLASICSVCAFAQTTKKTSTKTEPPGGGASSNSAVKTSAAYAEVLLRKTEINAELEEMLASYTEEFPKVKKARYESDLLQKLLTRILAINVSETSRLTQALGKLLVRKAELETDLWDAQRTYGGEHPNTKRAKRKFEIFEQAVEEVFP